MIYVSLILFCLLLESLLLGLGWTDLRIPYQYHYDFIYNSTLVKGILDNGWYLTNPYLGAPGVLAMHDYPEVANVNFLLVKLIGLFTSDWAVAINLFYVITFPLAAVAAFYVFREVKIPPALAWVGSLLFAFAPYHFLRMHHLVYTNYCFIPLITLVLIWIMRGEARIVFREPEAGRWRWDVRSPAVWKSLVIAVLVSGSVIYYSFFSCFLLVIAGAISYLNRKDLGALLTSWVLIALISLGVVLQMIPTWLYAQKHGENPLVVLRPAKESEEYGLKIAQLLLPVPGHRVEWMQQLRERYDRTAPYNNENRLTSLGLAGSVGFLGLLAVLVRQRREGEYAKLMFYLAGLNVAAVLLGTVGGFSSLFAYWVNPQIRAYNRLGIFIEFFSLFALVILLRAVFNREWLPRVSQVGRYTLCGAILVTGLLDQIPVSFKPPYSAIQKVFSMDAEFYERVEQSLPEGGRIFQLPFVGFPISKGSGRMVPYDHARGYLHTRNIHWSYGAISGRLTHIWQQNAALLPVREMAEILAWAGFQGIYIDRAGYDDLGGQIIQEWSQVLQSPPLNHSSGREVFFNMQPYIQRLKSGMSRDEWPARQQAALKNPLLLKGDELFQSLRMISESAGKVEMIRRDSPGSRGPVLVGGWAVDPASGTPAEKLMVVQKGRVIQLFVSSKVPRPDVAALHGPSALGSQWTMVLDTEALKPGDSSFEIYAWLKDNRLSRLEGCSPCTVLPSPGRVSSLSE